GDRDAIDRAEAGPESIFDAYRLVGKIDLDGFVRDRDLEFFQTSRHLMLHCAGLEYGPAAIEKLAHLVLNAESENIQRESAKDLHERGYGKPMQPQHHSG